MADVEKELKMAVIAGAAHALKYKEENWRASIDEVLRNISENMDEILGKMDNPL